ncbi:MAG: NAD-binding protein [Solirubrobacteraceae bacterium]
MPNIIPHRMAEGTTVPGSSAYENHHIVCGLNALGLRLAEHLHGLGEQVVVMRSEANPAYESALSALGVPILDGGPDDELALTRAGIDRAQAMALVADDDLGNLRGALLAAKRADSLRIVLRLFNEDLGERIKDLFEDCVILSQSAIAAPYFAAAALGEFDGERIAIAGRALLVERTRSDTDNDRPVLMALANIHNGKAELFPAQAEPGGQVITDLGPFEDAPAGRLHPPAHDRRSVADKWWSATSTVRQLLDTRLRIVLAVMVALLATGTIYFGIAKSLSPITSLYFTVVTLSTVGYGDINLQNDPATVKLVGVAFIMLGATVLAIFFAVLTDTIVGARLAQVLGSVRGRMRNHVVVCGLGNMGFRLLGEFIEQGVQVVAIERDDDSRHVAAARRMGIPVVVGDATLTETLKAAQVERAQAVVTATDNDVADLQAAVNARAIHPDVRIILRLFDNELSTAVEQRFKIHISRSTAVIAAPVFATEMLGHGLVNTVHVGGEALAFGECDVVANGPAASKPVSDLHASRDLRVLAVQRRPSEPPEWRVAESRVLSVGERIAVVGRAAVVQELSGESS